jgi:DNA processing protein
MDTSTLSERPLERAEALRAALAGLSIRGLQALTDRFGSLERALGAGTAALSTVPGLGPVSAVRLVEAAAPSLERLEERLAGAGITALIWGGAGYPAALMRGVADAPVVLFLKGDPAALASEGVAVVGTRRPTPWGVRTAHRLGRDLGGSGLTVVSGLAAGIDACAHQGCLEGSGCTVAVLAHGLHTVEPPGNRPLARRLLQQGGALVSEYPPGVPARRHTFVPRNRIIAALAAAVVVVEGGERSGARHTADFALDYDRHLLAVPGRPDDEQSILPNRLIREAGAELCRGPADVLAGLRPDRVPAVARALQERAGLLRRQAEQALRELGPEAGRLLELFRDEPLHVDELCRRSGLATPRVLALLLQMEIEGLVEPLPGMRYLPNWRPEAGT